MIKSYHHDEDSKQTGLLNIASTALSSNASRAGGILLGAILTLFLKEPCSCSYAVFGGVGSDVRAKIC